MIEDLGCSVSTRRSFLRSSILAASGLHLRFAFGEAKVEAAVLDLKVYDSATKQSIPSSIAIWDSTGKLITKDPGYKGGIRSSGEFHSVITEGRIKVVITRGCDYIAEVRELLLEPGKTTKCTVNLTRVSPLRKEGWVCGDSHVHMKHGQGPIQAGFPFMALTARAEALDYMSVAQQWNVETVTSTLLSQECASVSTSDCVLQWNMEAPKNYWKGDVSHCMGHGWTLAVRDIAANGADPISELFAMSAGDYQKEKVPTPNFESHAFIHATGGIVSYTHPCRIWRGEWGGKNGFPIQQEKFVSNMAQELPFDTIAGPTYDSIDILMQTKEQLVNQLAEQLWFMLLNRGYRIPATASTDAAFDTPGGATPGVVRVYTRIDGDVTLEKVAVAMKGGRNFVTSGPLLTFTVDGHGIGDVIPVLNRMRRTAHVQAWASGVPNEYLTKIEVIRNGQVYKTFELAEKPKTHTLDFDVEEDKTSWYIVKCYGSQRNQYAISNPIYFEAPGFQTPPPARANVELQVVASGSGKPLDGSYEILNMIGRESTLLSKGEFTGGRVTFNAPATARIRVRASGYESAMKSIFIDTPALLNSTLEMQLAELLDWATFEKVKKALDQIQLKCEMQPSA
ncbi:MAG TPA: CehA/McbA family metallohydrolase [Acidisarcina sp.]|nr:CehA/McbA family metallohydrolase [Acidisarcina sp.]